MVSENGVEYKKFVRLCRNFTECFVSSCPGSLRLHEAKAPGASAA